MAFTFKQFIIGNLPSYIIDQDSYKDAQGKGLLERYLGIFADYIDTELYPQINDYLNIVDASICGEQYLNHLSDVLGNPPDIFKNEEQYRNLLSYIVSVYKIKGTKAAYELFFNILGYKIEIEEVLPDLLSYIYDGNSDYDTEQLYDLGACESCSYYNIKFYPLVQDGLELDLSNLALLKAAIDFNEPINAKLNNFTFVLDVEDIMDITIGEEATGPILTGEVIQIYDNGEIYDENITIIKSSTSIRASTDLPSSIDNI